MERGTPIQPMRICDCAAPGLSTRNTSRRATCLASGSFAGAAAAFASDVQPPKLDSSSGIIVSGVVSPTTTSAAFDGRNADL